MTRLRHTLKTIQRAGMATLRMARPPVALGTPPDRARIGGAPVTPVPGDPGMRTTFYVCGATGYRVGYR